MDALNKQMHVLYVLNGLDRAIALGWMSGGPFCTADGVEMLDSWLVANPAPTDAEITSILVFMAMGGKIDLGGGSLGGQKAAGVEDFLELVKRSYLRDLETKDYKQCEHCRQYLDADGTCPEGC